MRETTKVRQTVEQYLSGLATDELMIMAEGLVDQVKHQIARGEADQHTIRECNNLRQVLASMKTKGVG